MKTFKDINGEIAIFVSPDGQLAHEEENVEIVASIRHTPNDPESTPRTVVGILWEEGGDSGIYTPVVLQEQYWHRLVSWCKSPQEAMEEIRVVFGDPGWDLRVERNIIPFRGKK